MLWLVIWLLISLWAKVSQRQGDILHVCTSCSLLNRSQLLLGFNDCLYDAKNMWQLFYRRQSWSDLILLLSQHCIWSVRLTSQVISVSIVTVYSSTRPGRCSWRGYWVASCHSALKPLQAPTLQQPHTLRMETVSTWNVRRFKQPDDPAVSARIGCLLSQRRLEDTQNMLRVWKVKFLWILNNSATSQCKY